MMAMMMMISQESRRLLLQIWQGMELKIYWIMIMRKMRRKSCSLAPDIKVNAERNQSEKENENEMATFLSLSFP